MVAGAVKTLTTVTWAGVEEGSGLSSSIAEGGPGVVACNLQGERSAGREDRDLALYWGESASIRATEPPVVLLPLGSERYEWISSYG